MCGMFQSYLYTRVCIARYIILIFCVLYSTIFHHLDIVFIEKKREECSSWPPFSVYKVLLWNTPTMIPWRCMSDTTAMYNVYVFWYVGLYRICMCTLSATVRNSWWHCEVVKSPLYNWMYSICHWYDYVWCKFLIDGILLTKEKNGMYV